MNKKQHNEEGNSRRGLQTYVLQMLDAEKLRNLTNIDFVVIFALFKQKGILNNMQKVKITKIIIQHLLEHNVNLEMNRYDFHYLSTIICEVFPSEIPEEYYTSSMNCQRPSGKLYDAYSNYRRLLSTAGIINRRRKKLKNPVPSSPSEEKAEPDICKDFNFVKTYTGSLEVFTEKWISCFTLRRNMLVEEKLNPKEYLSKFRLFSYDNKNIFKLFFEDCKMIYPDIRENLTWDFVEEVLEKARDMKLRQINVIKWLSGSEGVSDSCKLMLSLLILPYLFPSTKIKSSQNKESFKVTKVEMQENFIRYFESHKEAAEYEKFHIHQEHPQTVFVGPFDNLCTYVILFDRKYYFASPLEALEACFHAYHALNIRYPLESLTVWTFIQIYVFNVKTKLDKTSSSIKSIWHSLNSTPIEKRIKIEFPDPTSIIDERIKIECET